MSPVVLLFLLLGSLCVHSIPPPPCFTPCPRLCRSSFKGYCHSCVCPDNSFNVTTCPNPFPCPEKCMKYEMQSRCHVCRCDFRI